MHNNEVLRRTSYRTIVLRAQGAVLLDPRLPSLSLGAHYCVNGEGFETHPKNVRDFEIPRFCLRFQDFRWDFKISHKISSS